MSEGLREHRGEQLTCGFKKGSQRRRLERQVGILHEVKEDKGVSNRGNMSLTLLIAPEPPFPLQFVLAIRIFMFFVFLMASCIISGLGTLYPWGLHLEYHNITQ